MNAVYEITGPKNDLEGASVDPSGCLKTPVFNCKACGCEGSAANVWYASLQPNSLEAQELISTGLPDTVSDYAEYVGLCGRLKRAFATTVDLLPGSTIGVLPIEVRSKNYIGGLTTKKLKQGIDFIQSSCSWIASQRICQSLKSLVVGLRFGPIVFKTGSGSFTGYEVLELSPRLAWSAAERAAYQRKVCDHCGSSLKGVNKTNWGLKRFDASIFRDDYAIVRSAEDRGLYINERLYNELQNLKPTGVQLCKAGEVEP